MDSLPALPAGVRLVQPRSRRPLIIFAVVGLVLGLASLGLYAYRALTAPVEQSSPAGAVKDFLAAVFLTGDVDRVKDVVCAEWDPETALRRSRSQLGLNTGVTWDNVGLLSRTGESYTMGARLKVSFISVAPADPVRRWRFQVENQNGWRVCDARPLTPQ